MAAFKKAMDSINVNKLKHDIESAIDSKTDGLISDFKNSSLDPDKIEGQVEKAEKLLEPFEKATDLVDNYKTVKSVFTDPVGTIKSEAKDKITELLSEKIQEIPKVQEIKDQIYESVKSRIMDVPQVKKIKEEAEKITGQQFDVSAPKSTDEIEKIGDNPDDYKPDIPSTSALVARLLRESGITRDDLRN